MLILWLRMQAFLALLISGIITGLLAGMPAGEVIKSVQEGMGNTLGFVATVVGLGAIFGAILEHSGGALSLAGLLTKKAGDKGTSFAMMAVGFIIAIPVFFDVAFIILIPLLYSLQKKTGRSLLLYGIPLLGGLAVTHSFVPPTPGPIAVSEILNADLGKVIIAGIIIGFPSALIGGLWYGKYISEKIFVSAPTHAENPKENLPKPSLIFFIIILPILLIVLNTIINSPFLTDLNISPFIKELTKIVGHPFTALIIANLAAWYFLGLRRGISREELFKISSDSLAPAGIIILITGAGGVFKEVLSDTGTGKMLASALTDAGFSPLIFAFLTAGCIRILQGSATVAMITSAGMTASMLGENITEWQKALLVIAIASGATIMSHVNDSGFWLVGKYFGLDEKQTLRTWTVSTTLIGFTGFTISLLLWNIF
jgi:Gnt-I system low-affinity gluconate transporter